MDLRDLGWVVAVAEQGNVTDTAAILGVSQPTLSRAVARVERELGVRLLERTGVGVHPNEHGRLVVEGVREVLQRFDRVRRDLAERVDPGTGTVRLAFLDSLSTSLVPALLRDFHREAPGVDVRLTQEPSHEIDAELASGGADVGITSSRPDGAFGWTVLQEDRLVLVVPPTHRLAARRRVDLAELHDEEMVTIAAGFGFRRLTDRLLADAGVTPRIAFESADLATVEGLVAAGLGVALVPEPMAALTGSRAVALRARGATRAIGLVWRTDVAPTPVVERFLAFGHAWAERPRG